MQSQKVSSEGPFRLIDTEDFHKISTLKLIFNCEVYLTKSGKNKRVCFVFEDCIVLSSTLAIVKSENTLIADSAFELKFDTIGKSEYHENCQRGDSVIGFRLVSTNKSAEASLFFEQPQNQNCMMIRALSKILVRQGFHHSFKPIRRLGKGAFATVFQVRRIEDKARVAVKAFSKRQIFATKQGKLSLINQLRILRKLNHPSILKLQGVYQTDKSLYAATQIIRGCHLFDLINEKNDTQKFSYDEISKFMKSLLEAVDYLHSNRIMHRDLKPENIMLRNFDISDPVIIDFGLSSECDSAQYIFSRCGSPGFIAPEIVSMLQNEHIEPVCDIFSIGVIFHIMLTGDFLFSGSTSEQIYQNNKKCLFSISSEKVGKNSKNQHGLDLLQRMLKINPRQRITARQALNHKYFRNGCKDDLSPLLTEAESHFS